MFNYLVNSLRDLQHTSTVMREEEEQDCHSFSQSMYGSLRDDLLKSIRYTQEFGLNSFIDLRMIQCSGNPKQFNYSRFRKQQTT